MLDLLQLGALVALVKGYGLKLLSAGFNLLKPNDIYMSYRSANLQTLHFKYLFNKYTY